MVICGIKTTHDGALALIDNGKLIFSFEMEKINNGKRHGTFCLSMKEIENILKGFNYAMKDIDKWVLDGWYPDQHGDEVIIKNIPFLFENKTVDIKLAQYGRFMQNETDALDCQSYRIDDIGFSYNSYLHVSGHIFGAYCSSPYAEKKEDSFILIWDGGMPPQLFYYEYQKNKISTIGPLMLIAGNIYIGFPSKFEPYCHQAGDIAIAGKLMAYIALGEEKTEIIEAYKEIYKEVVAEMKKDVTDPSYVMDITTNFINGAKKYADTHQKKDKNMLTSLHAFLQEQLLDGLDKYVKKNKGFKRNLCFAGGSALNIKWNSAIRESGLFESMWVPPFPNDAGSAIGTACCEMMLNTNLRSLDWNVYSGPSLSTLNAEVIEFESYPCSLKELANILHSTNEPIVFLNGNAELGPRALGNRSIFAAAVTPNMKTVLNQVKNREEYRPIAPICLEEDAPNVFSPGTPDPYMLFEHMVREDWKNVVPAIIHLDGSSRLQTVNQNQNKEVYELLTHYKALSGVPLLSNTSANFKGSGFFPDVESVVQWGRVNFIWSNGMLYASKKGVSIIDTQEILLKAYIE